MGYRNGLSLWVIAIGNKYDKMIRTSMALAMNN